jgi:hypothetical protein
MEPILNSVLLRHYEVRVAPLSGDGDSPSFNFASVVSIILKYPTSISPGAKSF